MTGTAIHTRSYTCTFSL